MKKVVDGIIYSDDMKSVKGVADKGIKSAIIADGAEVVAMEAFADCTALKEVTIPNSMNNIKPSAFKNCTSLFTVHLADNVEHIASSWFTALPPQYEFNCDTESKTYSFIKRSKILRMHIKTLAVDEAKSEKKKQVQNVSIEAVLSSSLADYSDFEFKIMNSRRKTATSALIRIGKNCGIFRFSTENTKWMSKVNKIIEILKNQDKDASDIFAEIKANKLTLSNMSLPATDCINSDVNGDLNLFMRGSLKGCKINGNRNLWIFGTTSIGDMTDLNFETLTIGEGLECIWNGAFRDCKNLKSVTLSEGVLDIYAWAFKNCTSLTSIHLPESLREIDISVFENCTALSEVYIPKTISSIRNNAFKNTKIQNLGYSLHLQRIQDFKVSLVDYDFTIKGGLALENDDTLLYCVVDQEDITIFDGITKINGDAFRYRENIKYVYIPESVKEIGSSAFYNCYSLKRIEYGGTVEQWKAIKKGNNWMANVEAQIIIIGNSPYASMGILRNQEE